MASLQKIWRKQHILVFYAKSKPKIPDLGKAMWLTQGALYKTPKTHYPESHRATKVENLRKQVIKDWRLDRRKIRICPTFETKKLMDRRLFRSVLYAPADLRSPETILR